MSNLSMQFRLPFENTIDPELVAEIEKSAVYASSRLRSLRITPDRSAADIDCADDARDEVSEKVRKLTAALVRSFRSLGAPEELAQRARRDEGPIADAFAELVDRRWAMPLGRGQVSLAGPALAAKRAIDAAVLSVARTRFAAVEQDHPALLDPNVLVRCGYLGSFPHSISLVSHLTEDFDAIESFRRANLESDAIAVPEPRALTSTDAVLRPAACLPVYRSFEGASLAGTAVTTCGHCFRYESGNMEGLRRLWDFTMREIVFVGSAAYVEGQRVGLVDAVAELMEEWDLGYRLASASDPFFATVRATKALYQRSRALKYEMLVEVGSATIAAGSINFAGTLFGDAFAIKTDTGEVATTACIGFGLERLVYALFSQHGFDARRWPERLREVVLG
jgi:seryl-tRNA synthetase